MAQKFTVPVTIKNLSSAGSDGITVFLDQETYARLKVEAGGRITWGDGAGAGDTNLYRDTANALKTDDSFQALGGVITLATSGSPSTSIADGALAVDTTNDEFYFRSGGEWVKVGVSVTIDDLEGVVVTNPEEYQVIQYDGTNWVNAYPDTVSYVRNVDTVTLTPGMVVYIFGGNGDHATVKRADNSSDVTSSKTLGVVAATIPTSENGPVLTRGYVDGVNLSVGYAEGDVLWLGKNGAFTVTKPSAPDHLVYIGVVVRATVNGIIYVATQNGYEIDELHNVKINGVTDGQFLRYNGASAVWINDTINLGTDTAGNYILDVSASTGISVSHTPGEGSTATISLNATLDNLSDVSANSPTDGHFLKYISASAAWAPAAIPTINALDDIGNVSASSATTGQILVYNGSEWVNQDNTSAVTDLDGGTELIVIYEAEITNKVEATYDGGTL